MLRIALIGGGNHSRGNHLPALLRYVALHPGEVELSAFCDRRPEVAEAVGRDFGFARVYTDVAAMLAAESLDGCIAVTPIEVTATVARQVVAAGVPLLMEKPPGSTPEEARAICDFSAGARVMVSLNRRFDPALRAANDSCAGRPLTFVRASMLRHVRTELDFFTGTAIHALDAVRFLAGDIRNHSVDIRTVDGVRWYHVSLEFESGAAGTLDVLPTCGSVAETYELFGLNYRILVSVGGSDGGELRVWENGRLVVDEAPAQGLPPFVQNGAYAETEAFVRALRVGGPFWPSPADTWQSVELCHRIEGVG